MNLLLQKYINSISQTYKQGNLLKRAFPHLWYTTNNNTNTTSENLLKCILETRFPEAKTIQVEDVSGGCGAMYNVYVETKDFKGISIAKQHQAVYAALNEQIKQIHGLHLVTKVPP